MAIGIIGTGSVGTALARGLAAAGRDVVLGSRDPDAAAPDLGAGADRIETTTQRDAAERGSAVVLAVPAGVAVDLAGSFSGTLAGTTVVDPTNEYPDPGGERSVAERIAAAAPEATVVKCFNTIGAEHFTDPVVGGETASMFLAGEAGDHRDAVEAMAGDLGFEPVVVGDLGDAGHLEHLARLWIHLARERDREFAFRLIRE
jgi:hypothetical protein